MFRTELPLTPLPHQLSPAARVLTLGSCFSDSIGARLTEFKVATLVNPFGTVFNPISACKLLRAAAGEEVDWQQHVVEARGRWQSYDLHAEIGADSPVELLQHIQRLTREVGVFLATADVVVLTLGSAYAYRLRETGELVSNCHKVPAEQFDKELLTADEIIAAVAETHAYLRRLNPKLRLVLTVSPVRHLKDTLVLNSASKAMLRVACHYLSELLPDVTYFPAYELLLDDLRDYRFYATDMLHLSESAENYVWEKFTRTYFDAAFGRFKKEWEGIRQNLGHRPLHPAAPEHRAFLESTLERLGKLGGTADVRMELLHVERELASLPEPKSLAPVEEEVYDDGEERIDIGSFDDQAAVDEAPPVAAAVIADVAPASAKSDAGKKEAGKKEIRRAVFAKTRLTSQASLIQPGRGLLVEDAEETAPETEDTDAEETSDSAYDHAYSPTVTDLTDEVEGDEDDADDAAADESEEADTEETVEEAARRKKRRSRGGAKRTKRKHARLAAEQAGPEGQSEGSAVATAPAPLPDEPLATNSDLTEAVASEAAEAETSDEPTSDVVYVTEEELRRPRPRPEVVAPTASSTTGSDDEAVGNEAEADKATPGGRRGRNNRRGNKREVPRYGGRPGRQPLYAAEAEAPAPAATEPEAAVATEAPTPLVAAPAVVAPAAPAPAEAIVTPAAPAADEAVVAPAAQAAEATSPTVSLTDTVEIDKKPAAKKRPSRSKAPKKEAEAEAVAPADSAPDAATPAVETESAAPESAAPEPTAAEPKPAATAKPARRKPAAKPKATTTPATAAAPPAETDIPPVTAQAEPEVKPAKAPAKKRAAAKPKTPAKATAKEPATTTEPEAAPEPAKAATFTEPDEAATPPEKPVKPKSKATPKAAAKTKAAAKPEAVAKKAPAKAKAATKPGKKVPPEAPEGE